MILERGALLNNRYRIVEILGQGGMGSVYRAVDENLGVEVAVKDNFFTTDEYARQFRREATILASLRHSNMPRVTDHFVIEGQGQYLVMDYIEGEDLRQRMDRVGLLVDDDVIIIGAAICDALTYLGSRNPSIIHRDIKPGNVKITPQGQIFLVDFGLAKVLMGSQATTTGARAMTPGYSPPEQYGTARTDQRSDVFSLGATLYAALSGAIPEDALARAMDQCQLTPLRKRNARVSRKLASVIEKSLEVRPEDRYQDSEEFKQALLNARSNTRRKVGVFTVAPPPLVSNGSTRADNLAPQSLAAQSLASQSAGGDALPQVEGRSPRLLPMSTPLEESQPVRRRSRSRNKGVGRGCWVVFLLAGLFLTGGGLGVFILDPNIATQAQALISSYIPGGASPSPTHSLEQATLPVQANTEPPGIATEAATPVSFETNPPTPTLQPTLTAVPSATPTPMPTPLGGGGGQLVFASDSSGIIQIHLINADGSGLRRITDLQEGACQPSWSPDGERIVFTSPCPANQETYPGSGLFVINVDGSGMMPLPTMAGGDFDPAWSPDGTRIAFTTLRQGGRPRIFAYNLLDNTVTSLSNPDDPFSRDSQPAWSPDGKRIAFITTRRGPSQIWIMDQDGKNQELFSHSKDLINLHPTWSPDGQLILFTQYPTWNDLPRLVVAPVDENGLREVFVGQDAGPVREGKYSPDGLWIAYEGWPLGGRHDIFIMTASGVGRNQLTTEIRADFDPDWKRAK